MIPAITQARVVIGTAQYDPASDPGHLFWIIVLAVAVLVVVWGVNRK